MDDKKAGKLPFIMKPDGVASIFGPAMVEGPFPEHYEPFEGPLQKNLMSSQLNNPAIKFFKSDSDKYAHNDPNFPIVCSTYTNFGALVLRIDDQVGTMRSWRPNRKHFLK